MKLDILIEGHGGGGGVADCKNCNPVTSIYDLLHLFVIKRLSGAYLQKDRMELNNNDTMINGH